nr:uncharacterized protein LOC109759705 [Aegilops tauschii subsp. strangulata]
MESRASRGPHTHSALSPDEPSRPSNRGVVTGPVTPAHVFFCSSSPQLGSFSAVHSAARTNDAATTASVTATAPSPPTDPRGGRQDVFDDQDLGFFTNFLGIFIFVLVIAYHFVMADPKYEN